jgi:hypothetical protein
MMTLELDDETARLLAQLAEREHIGAVQLVKKALVEHAHTMREKDVLITDFAGVLANSPSFQGDPLEIQKAMRDEWD